jgi:hypothetical protein
MKNRVRRQAVAPRASKDKEEKRPEVPETEPPLSLMGTVTFPFELLLIT